MKTLVAALSAFVLSGILLWAEGPDLLENAKSDPGSLKEHKTVVTPPGADGAIRVEYNADAGYPGVQIPAPPEGWDLSGFTGVEAEITNDGTTAKSFALRVDNKGGSNASNTEAVKVGPGETKKVRVRFGYSYGGNPAYQLDPSAVMALLFFVSKPADGGAFVIKSVAPFKEEGNPAPAAAAAKPAAAAGGEGTASPSIGGELLDLAKGTAGFKFFHSSGVMEGDKLKVTFSTGTDYPNVQFPIPAGGWNLSAFGGVEVTATNTSGAPITAVLRVDNPGDWKQSPWNSQSVKIAPGATQVLQAVFGKNNGQPGYPLDAKKISAIQVYVVKPKEEITLLLSNLKGYGSPAAVAGKSTLTTPADRDTPVTPPDWLGKRPPVAGDWTLTFEDDFNGSTLDSSKWEASNSHFSKFFYYQKEKARVENGVLKLGAEKKAVEGREYISGQVTGFGKWAQSYGYFEVRVKLPTTRGFWPAFWLMPDRDVNGPTDQQSIWNRNSTKWGGMEFDILEHLSEWGPGRHNIAVHWDGYGDQHQAWGDANIYYGPTPDGWHVFGMLWEPGKLTWYIDGKKTAEWENPRVGSVPGHLLLSLQLGGWATKDIDLSKIDETFDIDYVKVWQRKDLAEAASKVDLSIPAKK
ncbi:MAG: hypothetical protein BGO12_06630 [Verrucomicrobia bacterium 61-8]|nr:glycoside hydrolase family 16 protein [Verrucomicrobiota bacterium]OJV04580.1 MAG: hypothetical protein BGO12_06630 [Verrucomicrobia bacterium 61-8]